METQLERELAAEQEELLDMEEDDDDVGINGRLDSDENEDDDREREHKVRHEKILAVRPGLAKVRSLPANFIYNPPKEKNIDGENVVDFLLSLT